MTTIKTELCDLLGIEHPIVQAAMGPSGTVELAAAVSDAGGLGMMSIASETAGERGARQAFSDSFDYLTEHTDGPFGVNIPVGSRQMPDNVEKTLDAYLEEVLVSKLTDERVADQLVLLETSAGNPERWIDKIQDVKEDTDLVHFHKVGSVKQAKKAADLGVDGITASGYEMGGHTHNPEEAAHTFVLLPSVTEAVDVPVVASGGVRDGRGLLAALALGAEGVYMGSRFMLTQEADFHDDYKEYVRKAGPGSDTLMEGVFGPARVLDSPGIEVVEDAKDEMPYEEYTDFKDGKFIDAQQGNLDDSIVIAGQVAGYIDEIPTVEELIDRILAEAARSYEDIQIEP